MAPNLHQLLGYDPTSLPRELKTYYLSASSEDRLAMLKSLHLESEEELFKHIPEEDHIHMKSSPSLTEKGLSYSDLAHHLLQISQKNHLRPHFLNGGYRPVKTPDLIPRLCGIRKLTTAYTPYQPERGQGTLSALWIYTNTTAHLLQMKAVNASLYDRATALYEALTCAVRTKTKTQPTDCPVVLLSDQLYPGDLEVVETLAKFTNLCIIKVPIDRSSGKISIDALNTLLNEYPNPCAFAFPLINHLAQVEDVHVLSDWAYEHQIISIGVVDPQDIFPGAYPPPGTWGKYGVQLCVGEGGPLGLPANFGGPGLGIFAIGEHAPPDILRNGPGRLVGKAFDKDGKECTTLVMSTREQHIRREQATSNICSNQSFVATLVGAYLNHLGSDGLRNVTQATMQLRNHFCNQLHQKTSLQFAFQNSQVLFDLCLTSPNLNSQVVAKINSDLSKKNLHPLLSTQLPNGEYAFLISFHQLLAECDVDTLAAILNDNLPGKNSLTPEALPKNKDSNFTLPAISESTLFDYYNKLGELNFAPDDNIYPLGSCTMKYNPYINDWAANLPGFTGVHPLTQESDCQGTLEILYHIQEQFKTITGLAAVTTQPVAGAQGEWVGLKMIQAYHHQKNPNNTKKIVLIPRSAHGTNPATASSCNLKIVTIEAKPSGEMDLDDLTKKCEQHSGSICALMATNPNTAGILESEFKKAAELVHRHGGLVYMDGANMNAIAGKLNLNAIGVDAVHNNLHKTWTIPHGGGGPGDAIVAVSSTLQDFLPGKVIVKTPNGYRFEKTANSIGSFHRHHGNVAHKIRAYTYLCALGTQGIREMSQVAVLSARYLQQAVQKWYPLLPQEAKTTPRMHEFILTFLKDQFDQLKNHQLPGPKAMAQIGKLFLDLGLHAPTVSFPEPLGLMIEPTESFSKSELDEFVKVMEVIFDIVTHTPELLNEVPFFTPVRKIDELSANKNITLKDELRLPTIHTPPYTTAELKKMGPVKIASLLKSKMQSVQTPSPHQGESCQNA